MNKEKYKKAVNDIRDVLLNVEEKCRIDLLCDVLTNFICHNAANKEIAMYAWEEINKEMKDVILNKWEWAKQKQKVN